MLRGTYARARVVVVREAVARTLMWIGAVGALAGLLIPSLTGLGLGALIGAGLFVLGLLVGLLQRRRWFAVQAAAAEKAAFAVTLEPPHETRQRLARGHALWLLIGIGATAALGVVAGPAAGLGVLGYGVGMLLSALRLARWERREEKLLWARTDDGRLFGRRSAVAEFVTTGPAGGNVKAVVHG
ncbi:hypothetical protein [Streptacidiphilus jiangxiensis]|uniref:Uncharacterized protein n=1 Tax=Streptacidiphilus jiangxiensis TaxID=235985 RepID=A0A1H7MGE3_STRJI|nr:hypothetical protein [Streptacidiphilus jiangxiensis]SEL10356.1 hypothetical protein SAMN05414137_105377 [Streptacidiphilus jiangxiensis]